MPIGSEEGGGPGGAGAIRAGAAYVEIFGKSRLKKDLDQAKSDLKSWTSAASEKSKKVGENLASTTGLAKFGSIAALVGMVTGIGEAYLKTYMNVEKFNAEMEKSNKLTAAAAEVQAQLRTELFARLGGRLEKPVELIAEPGRIKYAEEALSSAQNSLTGLRQNAEKAEEELIKLKTGWRSAVEGISIIGNPWQERIKQEREVTEASKKSLDDQRAATQGFIKDLKQQVDLMKRIPQKNWGAFADSVADLERELKLQMETLGMTADEAQIYRINMENARKGVKDTGRDLERLRDTMNELAEKKLFQGVKDDLKGLKDDLEFNLKTHGMTPDEIRRQKILDADRWNLVKEDPNLRGLLAMQKELQWMDQLKLPEELNNLATQVKGAFGGNLSGQLGIGDTLQRQQLDQLKNINNGVFNLPDNMAAKLANALKMGQ